MDSPKPFYYEDHGQGYSLFVNGFSEWFRSYEQLEDYVAAIHIPYELILVDLDNWDSLCRSGAFDA